ncbi:transcriptional regulator, TetR family [Rhizobiales bacterium GAS191]|nr:transcriptional regulator, TetR family [Rhizobiales bacterium GAS113]SEE47453.1 transcriptional regulator, TetR family [Rhizobiales bacterium GAS191]
MRHDQGHQKPQVRTRLKPDERRRLIVEAAFKALAQEGFEGLRTRDIAASVGINSATLHHYFQTKHDLIAGIAEHLERRLRAERAPLTPQDAPAALDPFGRQFEDLVFYQLETPEVLAVYREFVARAPRDAAIRALVGKLHAGWKAGIVAALAQAQAQRVLRADIDLDAAAGLVLSTAWGLVAQIFASTTELKAAAEQLRLLMRPLTKRTQLAPK